MGFVPQPNLRTSRHERLQAKLSMSEPPVDEQAGTRRGWSGLLEPPVAAAINHLLKSASWARERLKPCAGKIARFKLPPFTVTLVILDSGELADASALASADASFTLTPGIALRMLAHDQHTWQQVEVSGDTALTREILYVAQNLRWDFEEDLSRVFGDVAAHRMTSAARELDRWRRDTVDSFARSAAAYWTEERPLIAARENVERFVRDVDQLRDDVARLEKRLGLLMQRSGGH
jgi:ubiquinone biosynthesis protein UbiJ